MYEQREEASEINIPRAIESGQTKRAPQMEKVLASLEASIARVSKASEATASRLSGFSRAEPPQAIEKEKDGTGLPPYLDTLRGYTARIERAAATLESLLNRLEV